MKSIILAISLSASFWCSDSASNCVDIHNPATTTFAGRTPCGDYFKSFLEISPEINCEMIRWELSLYHNSGSNTLSTFLLKYNYGMNKPNTEDFAGGGNLAQIKGFWKMLKGTKTNSNATVYQLESNISSGFISLVKLDDRVLHFLYSDKSLMVGNAGYSYTLYKVKE